MIFSEKNTGLPGKDTGLIGAKRASLIENVIKSGRSSEAGLRLPSGYTLYLDDEVLTLLERYYSQEEICFPDDYIAIKRWNEDDVRGQLVERGFAGTDAQVTEVINTGMLDSLNDCTDSDWEIINYAIDNTELYKDGTAVYYRITFCPGMVMPNPAYVVTSERTTDYQALLDAFIDKCEEEGYDGLFDDDKEQPDDMVMTGGNCGRRLITGGMLEITEVSKDDVGEAWLMVEA